jgi:hypothetical protein
MNLVTIYDIQNKFVGMFACVFLLYIVNFIELIELLEITVCAICGGLESQECLSSWVAENYVTKDNRPFPLWVKFRSRQVGTKSSSQLERTSQN